MTETLLDLSATEAYPGYEALCGYWASVAIVPW